MNATKTIEMLEDTIDKQACDIYRLEAHIKTAVDDLKTLRKAATKNKIDRFGICTLVDIIVGRLMKQID